MQTINSCDKCQDITAKLARRLAKPTSVELSITVGRWPGSDIPTRRQPTCRPIISPIFHFSDWTIRRHNVGTMDEWYLLHMLAWRSSCMTLYRIDDCY